MSIERAIDRSTITTRFFFFKATRRAGRALTYDFNDYTFDPTKGVGLVGHHFAIKKTRAPPPHEGSSTFVKGIELFTFTFFFLLDFYFDNR